MLLLSKVFCVGQLIAAAVAVHSPNSSYPATNFKAIFGSSPQPMTVDVNPDFIAQTKLKVALTRFPIEIDGPQFVEGLPNENLTQFRDYWLNHYDWDSVQQQLNSNFSHFTTTVGPLDSSSYNYTLPIPLHFVHHRSERPDAIPLLFVHGYPGSFLEVSKIINLLTTPPDDDSPAFHVVAPSIPGFGFSPAATEPGLGLIEVGAAFNELMKQLGYDRYVAQGGDFGAITIRYMAAMFPDSTVSILSNLWGEAPTDADLLRYSRNETTAEESSFIEFFQGVWPTVLAFWGVESTFPLQLGTLLNDSPIGNLGWLYWGTKGFSPGYDWGLEELITWSMMLYIPGPYGSVRTYAEMKKASTLDFAWKDVSIPVGVLQYFPDVGYGVPRDWLERQATNITYFSRKPLTTLGGHFPATINPTDLVDEMRTFWGSTAGGWTS
ncbi:hypothetical protein V2G26_000258 [Clonostachys chloroleuca]